MLPIGAGTILASERSPSRSCGASTRSSPSRSAWRTSPAHFVMIAKFAGGTAELDIAMALGTMGQGMASRCRPRPTRS